MWIWCTRAYTRSTFIAGFSAGVLVLRGEGGGRAGLLGLADQAGQAIRRAGGQRSVAPGTGQPGVAAELADRGEPYHDPAGVVAAQPRCLPPPAGVVIGGRLVSGGR